MLHNFGPEKKVVVEPGFEPRTSHLTCKHSTYGTPSQMSILTH